MKMDEIITTGDIVTEENPDVDYIAAIQAIKESTVSKEQYDKLRVRNKQLLDALSSGGSVEFESQPAKVDIAELRKKLYKTEGGDITDLEYISNTLKLREAIMQAGGRDPFLPANSSAITEEMIEKYDLKPEECVFVDDTWVNVEAAAGMGFHIVHAKEHSQVLEALCELGVPSY